VVTGYWWSLHTDLQQQQAAAQKTAAQGRSGGPDHGYQHNCTDQEVMKEEITAAIGPH
jgi:hypothetical protein